MNVAVAIVLGTFKLAATPCSIDGPAPSLSHVDGGIAVTPAGVIVVIDAAGVLHGYRAKPGKACVLERDRSFGDDGTLSLGVGADGLTAPSLSVDREGTIYAETGSERFKVRRGRVAPMCGGGNLVTASPRSKWIWRWTIARKVTREDGACGAARELEVFPDGYVGTLFAIDDRVVVDSHDISVRDERGRELAELAQPPGGALNAVRFAACGDAICAVGQHALAMWRSSGDLIGAVELGDLLSVDVDNGWNAAGFAMGGGAAYVLGNQYADHDRGTIFRVDGLPR